jgi:DNA-directed RNA polymerase subunit RPC12/RpoP
MKPRQMYSKAVHARHDVLLPIEAAIYRCPCGNLLLNEQVTRNVSCPKCHLPIVVEWAQRITEYRWIRLSDTPPTKKKKQYLSATVNGP